MNHLLLIAVLLLTGCSLEQRREDDPAGASYYESIPVRSDEHAHAEPHEGPSHDSTAHDVPITQRNDEPPSEPTPAHAEAQPPHQQAAHDHPHPPAAEATAKPNWHEHDDANDGWPEPEQPLDADASPLAQALLAHIESHPPSWSAVAKEDRFRFSRPTLIILTATWCQTCPALKETAESLSRYVSVGSRPSDQIQIYDIDTTEGQRIDAWLGEHIYGDSRPLTDRKGGVPLLVRVDPGGGGTIAFGWQQGVTDTGRQKLMNLLRYDETRRMAKAAARVSLPSLIAFFFGPGGRREVASGLYLTCPLEARVEFDPKADHPRLHFPRGGPAFEYRKWPIPTIRKEVASFDSDWNMSKVNLWFKGDREPMVIEIDQGAEY